LLNNATYSDSSNYYPNQFNFDTKGYKVVANKSWKMELNQIPEDVKQIQILVSATNSKNKKNDIMYPFDIRREYMYGEEATRATDIQDKNVFRLIMFKYAKEWANNEHKMIVDTLAKYIWFNSNLTIKGYTDYLYVPGVSDMDTLSNKRAKKIKTMLQRILTQNSGKTINNIKTEALAQSFRYEGFYPDELPEGRFYNRTVEIEIETPVIWESDNNTPYMCYNFGTDTAPIWKHIKRENEHELQVNLGNLIDTNWFPVQCKVNDNEYTFIIKYNNVWVPFVKWKKDNNNKYYMYYNFVIDTVPIWNHINRENEHEQVNLGNLENPNW